MRPLENAMRVLSVREISCTAKAVFVTRASDEDRRSRRRGDDWRRSPSQSNLREAKGTALRPSSHGVAAPSRAAFAARQMRRAFVVRADRRNALMKRQFHLPNAPNMRISQCFQGCALHSHPKTGDISANAPRPRAARARRFPREALTRSGKGGGKGAAKAWSRAREPPSSSRGARDTPLSDPAGRASRRTRT